MKRDDIIRMAREATKEAPREDWNSTAWVFGDETLERFAALVAFAERESLRESFRVVTAAEASAAILHEREACAKIADENAAYWAGYKIANAIRARGKHDPQ